MIGKGWTSTASFSDMGLGQSAGYRRAVFRKKMLPNGGGTLVGRPTSPTNLPAVRNIPKLGSNSAFNKIQSTLKNDWGAAQSAYKTFSGARAQGTRMKTSARGAGKHLLRGMGKGAKGRLGGYGAIASLGMAAAADFANPWGLGWGD